MIAQIAANGELQLLLDLNDIERIKKAIQDILAAYNTAYTSEQIEARNECSECLGLINTFFYTNDAI